MFCHRLLNYPCPSRLKSISVQMSEYWVDDLVRLYNPLFDLFPLVVRKIEAEGGCECFCPQNGCLSRVTGACETLSTYIFLVFNLSSPSFESSSRINPAWKLVVVEIRLYQLGNLASSGHSYRFWATTPQPAVRRWWLYFFPVTDGLKSHGVFFQVQFQSGSPSLINITISFSFH